MKKLAVVPVLLAFILFSCKKQFEKILVMPEKMETSSGHQQRLFCGMEQAMAAMSPELKQSLLKSVSKTASQADELLVFLDFDGALVRPGNANPSGLVSPIISSVRNCPAPSLTPEQKQEIIDLVKDDFSPFNIVITTDQSVFNTYDAPFKHICIITTVPQVLGFSSGVGGVSPFAGMGMRLPFNPCFVFSSAFGNNPADVASTISHEVGHNLGLEHQSLYNSACGFVTTYHPGFGTGPTSFAPIMGSGFQRITNWFAQDCLLPLYGQAQNDFAAINNQVVLREDDFPDAAGSSSVSSSGEITGVLEEDGDVDFIKINFKNPGAVTVSSENIDLKVSIYTIGGHLLDEYTDPDDTGVTIPNVNGNRYLKIEAISNPNMSSRFMTGQYKITY